jgi:hypothetical protein
MGRPVAARDAACGNGESQKPAMLRVGSKATLHLLRKDISNVVRMGTFLMLLDNCHSLQLTTKQPIATLLDRSAQIGIIETQNQCIGGVQIFAVKKEEELCFVLAFVRVRFS